MKTQKIIKWIARIIGGLAVIFFAAFFIGEGVPDLIEGANGQLRSITILLGFAILGYIFAWFKEKEGGIVMTLSGFLMGMYMIFYGGTKDIVAALIYALPFIIPGLLFWWIGKERVES